jgi:hypothetical protein
MDKKQNTDHITVSIHMKVDGKLMNMKEVTYERGRETGGFTLDSLARLLFMWEHRFSSGSTYLMDGLLQEAEKKLPKEDNETAQSVFEKYWINWEKTMNEEFEKLNQGDNESEFPLWPEKNDFLIFEIWQLLHNFSRNTMPVKYGFLYWFHKYIMHSDINEYLSDLNNIPDFIKEIVDEKIIDQKKK